MTILFLKCPLSVRQTRPSHHKCCFVLKFIKLNMKMNNELDDFLEFVDSEEQRNINRVPKRYIRDAENPMELYNKSEFLKRYRFTNLSVRDILVPLLNIPPNINNIGLPIPPIMTLLVALSFYATGSFQTVHGDLRGLSQATVSRIIKNISIIFAELSRQFIMFPQDEIQQSQDIHKFYQIYGFPSVSGSIDCTHIPIRNPGTDAEEVFRNRKHYFSLNVQVIAGPNLEILGIVATYSGSAHDNTIFERNVVRVRFMQQYIKGKLLGDNGYACRPYIQTPLLNPQTPSEASYNSSHIRTRNIVERLFGIWKRRFPCLQRVLATNLERSVAIICACAVLHNVIVVNNLEIDINDPLPPEDDVNENININYNVAGLAYRRAFIEAHF